MQAANFLAAAALAAAVGLSLPVQAVQDYATAQFRFVSAPDCVGPGNLITQSAQAPFNQTFMRVQHIGDPGTAELAGQVANRVTWPVGQITGLHMPWYASAQYGYRDVGLPVGSSAFQLWCNSAGFLINTWQFSHKQPLVGEGPSASVARELSPPPSIFRNASSELTIQAEIKLPWMHLESVPVADGTAQVSFFYYAQDVTTGVVFAHLIALYDNRAPGVGGAGVEGVGSDGQTAFIDSPLLAIDTAGQPVRYATVSPYSHPMQFRGAWSEARFFRAHVPYPKFAALLTRLKAESLPTISTRPEDYRILLFGVLGEVFPGTTDAHNVSLGASVTDLMLLEAF